MARQFDDASSQYIGIDSAVVTATPLTMACWFYLDDLAADHTFLYTGDKDAVSDDWFQLRYDQSSNEYRFGIKSSGNETNTVSTATPASSEWVHIAGAAVSSTSRKILVNGTDKATSGGSRTPSGIDSVAIGRMGDPPVPDKYMDGRIAEVAFWDVELTDAEIGILAAGYSPLFVRPQSLVAYWPLIRDEDQDRVGG
jgi:hypothetical protein